MILKTSEEWQKEFECLIYDPDGWDRHNYQYSWYEEKIDEKEFKKRVMHSTILKIGKLAPRLPIDPMSIILDSAHFICLNCNDFFAYSTADALELDCIDLDWVVPIVKKYDTAGLYACMAYIRKCKPLKDYIDDDFNSAYKELEELNPKIWTEIE